MKVYLQYPWKLPDSPYYKNLISNPQIEYFNASNQQGVITSSIGFWFSRTLKDFLRKILNIIKMPNITKTPKGDYDLIHCCHCLSKNKTPWVVDVEHYWNFASSGELAYSESGKRKIKEYLLSPYCKKIIAWTHACKDTIIESLQNKEIKNKIEVVYPSVSPQEFSREGKKEITLLFVGRYFYQKGGLHIVEVFDRITKEFDNVNAIIVSETPKDILNKYSSNKKIVFHSLMPQEELFELYKESDIFVYPGYSDTFGFALLEAMSFGLPIITVDGFARDEIVGEDNGILIKSNGREIDYNSNDEEIIQELIDSTILLIKNNFLRERISINNIKEIKDGKFSKQKSNEKINKIYKEAIC